MPVTARNFNYAGPVFGLLLVFLCCDWIFRGRKRYEGPLKLLLEVSERNERDERDERLSRGSVGRGSFGRSK